MIYLSLQNALSLITCCQAGSVAECRGSGAIRVNGVLELAQSTFYMGVMKESI
jgi:hypothetical protein